MMKTRFVFGLLPALVIYSDTALPDWQGGKSTGPVVILRTKYRGGDEGIHQHELTHVRQWYMGMSLGLAIALALALWPPLAAYAAWWSVPAGAGIGLHPVAYKISRAYRRWAEVSAYREQLRHYDDGRDRVPLFAAYLAERYGLGISSAEAERVIRG